MRSTADAGPDDRTTQARIRDAAIECFATHGVAKTTSRKVATLAGVSPGLIIHHFGSMEGLRRACDQHVAAIIRLRKREAMSGGPGFDPLAGARDPDAPHLLAYLAEVLVDDSPAVAALVDEIVDDATEYMELGVESGMLRPSANPRGRAAVLALWSLGALALHNHMERILGVDLTNPALGADPNFAAYAGPVMEMLGEGMVTKSFLESLDQLINNEPEPEPSTARAPQPEPSQEGAS